MGRQKWLRGYCPPIIRLDSERMLDMMWVCFGYGTLPSESDRVGPPSAA